MKAYANATAFKQFIREPYCWPGGYAKVMLCNDGECICHACAKAEFRNILHSTLFGYRDGWDFAGVLVNWEDPDLYCAHCGKQIPCEYSD